MKLLTLVLVFPLVFGVCVLYAAMTLPVGWVITRVRGGAA